MDQKQKFNQNMGEETLFSKQSGVRIKSYLIGDRTQLRCFDAETLGSIASANK